MAASLDENMQKEIQKWSPTTCIQIFQKSVKCLLTNENESKNETVTSVCIEILKRLRILLQLTSYKQQTEDLSKEVLLDSTFMLLNANKDGRFGEELNNKVYTYMKSILFQMSHQSGFISKLKSISLEDLEKVLEPIKEIINKEDDALKEAALNFCILMLKEVLKWQGDDNANLHFKILSVICRICGFSTENDSIDEATFQMVSELLEVACDPSCLFVNSNSSCREVKPWLFKITQHLLDMKLASSIPQSYWFKCVLSIMKIDPSVVMAKMNEIFSRSFFSVKNKNWNTELDTLLRKIYQLYFDLRHTHKLISVMLSCIKEKAKSDHSSVESFLSMKVIRIFEVTYLPPGQNFQIWQDIINLLGFFLAKVNKRELSNGYKCGCLTTLKFFDHFLSSVKLADNSIPAGLIPKLEELMLLTKNDLTVKILAEVKPVEKEIMDATLGVLYTWGELELLLKQYCFIYKSSIILDESCVENLSDLSVVLSNSSVEIQKLFSIAEQQGNEAILYRLLMLMMQKLRCIFVFMNDDGKRDSLITKILDFIYKQVSSKATLPGNEIDNNLLVLGTTVAEIIMDNMKICYPYLTSKQLSTAVDVVLRSQKYKIIIDMTKYEDSLSQGLESSIISSFMGILSDSVIPCGVKRKSHEDASPIANIKCLFTSSSLSKNGDNVSEDRAIKSLSQKFITLVDIISKIKLKNVRINYESLAQTLQILKKLPLEFLSPSNVLDLYMGTLFYYCILRKHDKDVSEDLVTELTTLLSILTSCGRNKPTFLNCCNGISLLRVLTSAPYYQVNSSSFKKMLVNLVLIIMANKECFESLDGLISQEHFTSNLSIVLLLLETFLMGMKMGVGSTRISRQYFWRLATAFIPMNDAIPIANKVTVFKLMIEVSVSRDKFIGTNNTIPEWKPSLMILLDKIFSHVNERKEEEHEIDESLKLISTFWCNKNNLIEDKEQELKFAEKSMYFIICNADSLTSHQACIKELVEKCSLEAYTPCLEHLASVTIGATESRCTPLLDLWTTIMSLDIPESKTRLLMPYLNRVFSRIFSFYHNFDDEINIPFIKSSLKLQTSCSIRENFLNLKLCQVFLQGCQMLPLSQLYSNMEYTQLFEVMSLLCKLLNQLLMKHTNQIIRGAPVFLIILNQLLNYTVLCADQNRIKSGDYEELILKLSASVKRLLVQFSSHKKHLDKVVSAIISQYVSSVCQVTILPTVKNILQQGINSCFSSADPHTIDHLRVATNTSSREVFKSLHENFVTHHRYTGKV